MTVLVTGATGFVGSAVARRLLREGMAVRVLARAGSDRRNLDGLNVEICEGDLTDRGSLDRAVAGAQALFHVAADYRLWALHPQEIYRANVDGTRALMLAALDAGVPRIVYTSSVATLGLHADGTAADEDTPVALENMIGPYKRSKYMAEEEVSRLVAERGLPAVIVNPSTPIGPGDIKPTPTGRMIRDAVAGRMPAYVDTGLNIVHVDDVAEGHWLALHRGAVGERYILGGENMSLGAILAEIAALVGRSPPRVKLPHGLIMPVAHVAEAWARLTRGAEPMVVPDAVRMARKRMYFTCAKARAALGYAPRPAQQAIADAVAWFRGRAA
ncbi:MAG: SDR family NAD(P)-dependent oxidoreductase [Rhodospirillaceae bacterium]|nr:SDR family NAD(P)-dependent oxidoreductase [Rhodospirillaceae bacterium]